jgi:hypothetical protein
MNNILPDPVRQDNDALCALFEAPLRTLARRAVRVWFNRERLDQVLSEALDDYLQCDLIYAIDSQGRQVSSNVSQDTTDRSAYGQDLSQRPYAVTTSVLNNAAFQGVFLCDAYISQANSRPCITVMYGITSGPTTLGFLAADLDLQTLPAL